MFADYEETGEMTQEKLTEMAKVTITGLGGLIIKNDISLNIA